MLEEQSSFHIEMWLEQTYDFAWCVIVFTIYGDQMDLFGVGHKSWDDREASVAYVALLRKYCHWFISLDLLSSFFLRKEICHCFSVLSTQTYLIAPSTMVVSIRAPVEPLYHPKWKGDNNALKTWFGDKLQGLDLNADQQAALKAEGIDDPSDLFLLDDEAVDALHKNLATRSYDKDGKALLGTYAARGVSELAYEVNLEIKFSGILLFLSAIARLFVG